MQESFAEFLEGAHEALTVDQDDFLSRFQINSFELWDYDRDSGIFSLFKTDDSLHFAYQAIGTYSETTKQWQWAWDNENTYPSERALAGAIRDFGQKKGYDLLTTSQWETERDEGWDILAIAHKVQKNLGYYRIPQDGEHMFVAFTDQLSLDEAEARIKGAVEMTACAKHGLNRTAYVCEHLANGTATGFHEPFKSSVDKDLAEDDDFQAWCNDCELVRANEGGWNEKSEAFANVQIVCEECFKEMKEQNSIVS